MRWPQYGSHPVGRDYKQRKQEKKMNSKRRSWVVGLMALGLVAFCGGARAALIVNNGSFESTTGTLYNAALGGLYEASDWQNLSQTNYSAARMTAGEEGTSAANATGTYLLRLVSDIGNPLYTGVIAQYLGTMSAGESYTVTADAFGGSGAGLNWGATGAFVGEASATPSTVYETQTVDGVAAGAFGQNAFNFSYTATAGDAGNPLYIWFRTLDSGAGQARRGGIDNVQLSVIPEPASGMLLFSAAAVIALIRRKIHG
jgi:hypothetical protein